MTTDHAAGMTTVRAWLLAGCGDYNETLRRGLTHYLDAIAAHVMHHRDGLAAGLTRFHGLYRVEDWCWSALRPLPRAWWRQDGDWLDADLAFWSGDTVIAMRSRDFDTGELPIAFQYFWQGNGAGLMAHADVSNRTVGPRPAFSARDDLATIARA